MLFMPKIKCLWIGLEIRSIGLRSIACTRDLSRWSCALHGCLSKGFQPIFKRASEKTKENSDLLGPHVTENRTRYLWSTSSEDKTSPPLIDLKYHWKLNMINSRSFVVQYFHRCHLFLIYLKLKIRTAREIPVFIHRCVKNSTLLNLKLLFSQNYRFKGNVFLFSAMFSLYKSERNLVYNH